MYISDPEPTKTRADGSIDISYYLQRGRHLRSEAAHEMLGRATKPAPKPSPWRLWSMLRLSHTA